MIQMGAGWIIVAGYAVGTPFIIVATLYVWHLRGSAR